MINQLSPQELKYWTIEAKDFQLIDVREQWEHEAYNIGGKVMTVSRLMTDLEFFRQDIPLIIYCEKGIRSVIACQRLEQIGFHNLYNLAGGMEGWRNMIGAEATITTDMR